jgi:hypothetical protein
MIFIDSEFADIQYISMGYQFCRIQLFSRKGKGGRNTDFIFDEVSRVPSACLHVSNPDNPEILFGLDVQTLRKRHDDHAAAARTVTLAGKSRAIRSDQNTLIGIVLSHPATVEDYRANVDTRKDVNTWERHSISWLKKQFGDQLITVVRHLDESHPHLHAYILPADFEMKAANLHPGFAAKNAIMSSAPMSGEDDRAHKKRADRAYVQAMRSWLDDYHQHVAIPSGLLRLGPGKRRLTRAEWQREKIQAAGLKATLKRAKKVEARVTKIVHDAKDAALVARQEAVEAENLQKRYKRVARHAAEVAAKAHQDLNAAQASTRRLRGLGGQFRAAMDGFQSSRIAQSIATRFRKQIDTLNAALKIAQQDLANERHRRRDLQQKLTATSASLHETAAARDHAMKSLIKLRKNLEHPLQVAGYRYDNKGLRP